MADELSLLHQLVVETREAPSSEALLQSLVDRTSGLLGVVRVAAYLFTQDQASLSSVARAGMPIHRTKVEYRPGEGLIGWIAQAHRPLRTGDAEGDPRFLPRQQMTTRIGSFVGVPLLAWGKAVGVLSATHPEPDHFSAHHERLLELAAALCAPHLVPAGGAIP